MNILALVALAIVLVVNGIGAFVPRARAMQPTINMVAPFGAMASLGVRNYLSSQKAYQLFVDDRLAESAEVARQHAAWGPTLHGLVACVIVLSIVGLASQWLRSHRWSTGVAVVFWVGTLILWMWLRQIQWTRMV